MLPVLYGIGIACGALGIGACAYSYSNYIESENLVNNANYEYNKIKNTYDYYLSEVKKDLENLAQKKISIELGILNDSVKILNKIISSYNNSSNIKIIKEGAYLVETAKQIVKISKEETDILKKYGAFSPKNNISLNIYNSASYSTSSFLTATGGTALCESIGISTLGVSLGSVALLAAGPAIAIFGLSLLSNTSKTLTQAQIYSSTLKLDAENLKYSISYFINLIKNIQIESALLNYYSIELENQIVTLKKQLKNNIIENSTLENIFSYTNMLTKILKLDLIKSDLSIKKINLV